MVLVELCERYKKDDCKCAFKIKHYLNDNIKCVGSYISPNILFREKALTTKRIFSNVQKRLFQNYYCFDSSLYSKVTLNVCERALQPEDFPIKGNEHIMCEIMKSIYDLNKFSNNSISGLLMP